MVLLEKLLAVLVKAAAFRIIEIVWYQYILKLCLFLHWFLFVWILVRTVSIVMHSLSFSLTVAFLSLFIYVNGSINDFDTNSPSGEGCVDTTGFLECFKAQESSFIDCGTFCNTAESLQNRNYNDCIVGCGETRAAANIGCWIQSCWSQVCCFQTIWRREKIGEDRTTDTKQVYSCEYQLTAINYLSTIDRSRSPVPFYPAPDGASGACCMFSHILSTSIIKLTTNSMQYGLRLRQLFLYRNGQPLYWCCHKFRSKCPGWLYVLRACTYAFKVLLSPCFLQQLQRL